MKQRGCSFEYEDERAKDLLRAYREAIAQAPVIRLQEIFEIVVRMPSRRFWCSEERASIVVAAIERRGLLSIKNMQTQKREMYTEIYRRYKKLRTLHPSLSLQAIVGFVVSHPAPRFYLTPASARIIYFRIKRRYTQQSA